MVIKPNDVNKDTRIGIGYGFNAPQASLEIAGNLNVHSNANFGHGIKIGNIDDGAAEHGMIRFTGKRFESYQENHWAPFGAEDIFDAVIDLPYESELFQVYKVSTTYKSSFSSKQIPDGESNWPSPDPYSPISNVLVLDFCASAVGPIATYPFSPSSFKT